MRPAKRSLLDTRQTLQTALGTLIPAFGMPLALVTGHPDIFTMITSTAAALSLNDRNIQSTQKEACTNHKLYWVVQVTASPLLASEGTDFRATWPLAHMPSCKVWEEICHLQYNAVGC